MKKTILLLIILLLAFSVLSYTQEEDDTSDYIKIDENIYDLLEDDELQLYEEIKETEDDLYYSILYMLLEFKTFIKKYRTIGNIGEFTVIEPLEIKEDYKINWKQLATTAILTGRINTEDEPAFEGDFLKPEDFGGINAVIVFYDKVAPSEEKKCYYVINIDDTRVGTTNVAYLGQEKIMKLQLPVGKRSLFKAVKYINDRRQGAWIKALNIEQLSELYIVGAKDKIMKIEFIYDAETKKYSYKNGYLKEGDEAILQ